MFRIKRLFKQVWSLKTNSINCMQSCLVLLSCMDMLEYGHKNKSEISTVG